MNDKFTIVCGFLLIFVILPIGAYSFYMSLLEDSIEQEQIQNRLCFENGYDEFVFEENMTEGIKGYCTKGNKSEPVIIKNNKLSFINYKVMLNVS